MRVAILKYNAGNIMSVDFALQRLGVKAVITDDAQVLSSADKVIFPGVGEASTTMKYLRDHNLDNVIKNLTQPVLGICLGLQLMCSYSEEGDTECIGIFDEKVRKFIPGEEPGNRYKVPHMGWNGIYDLKGEIFRDIAEGSFTYFVHSYYAVGGAHTSAKCDYSVTFSAALQKDNYFATQFHPEKSGQAGASILKSFIGL
jgi:imidazole glycerol-phosphate synthase subunit HisH